MSVALLTASAGCQFSWLSFVTLFGVVWRILYVVQKSYVCIFGVRIHWCILYTYLYTYTYIYVYRNGLRTLRTDLLLYEMGTNNSTEINIDGLVLHTFPFLVSEHLCSMS